jgi:perosamine synthetase
MQIPISKIIFTEKEFENIVKPLKSGWVVQGPYVREFEKKWSRFTGAEHSIATSNCTTALQLTLSALGIGQGDEVIVPSFTWVATANAVETTGAKPVLCDINLRTFNIDAEKIQELVNKETRAIIPVHQFGLPADMEKILDIASRNELFVVEDAACGFGARYKGKHVGIFGHAGCFSFHPRKAITTGEGGMITTSDGKLAEKLKAMRDHGAQVSDYARQNGSKPYLLSEFPYTGFNYRMTDIQGAIGSSQMEDAGSILSKRRAIAHKYDALFDEVKWLQRPASPDKYEHGYQSYVCLFKPKELSVHSVETVNRQRNEFMEYLQQNGISTRPGTHAVHLLEYYARKYSYRPKDFPNSLVADKCTIAFPLYPTLSEEEFEYIAEKVKGYRID